MRVITTPWKDTFLELVSKSKKSIKITSPFVKETICNELLSAKKSTSKIELITSFKLGTIHSGSLDINAIESIINSNGIVKNFSRLHSKIYLFDEREVIISSGNLTNGGLVNNYEYGIYSNDKSFVSKVVSDFNSLSNNENTGRILIKHLLEANRILSKLPKVQNEMISNINFDIPEEKNDVLFISNEKISSSLKGWKLEIFNCINSISNDFFSLADVYQFESHLKTKYPKNNEIAPKIRQQLQNLRDIGLIEFLGNGTYKKLWK